MQLLIRPSSSSSCSNAGDELSSSATRPSTLNILWGMGRWLQPLSWYAEFIWIGSVRSAIARKRGSAYVRVSFVAFIEPLRDRPPRPSLGAVVSTTTTQPRDRGQRPWGPWSAPPRPSLGAVGSTTTTQPRDRGQRPWGRGQHYHDPGVGPW